MSIVDHGNDSLAWVCRCSNGLRSSSRPWIHIFAGENVCIHAITPMQRSSRLASRQTRRIVAESISTGFHTICAGDQARHEPFGDSPRLRLHLAQRLLAVQRLAAR